MMKRKKKIMDTNGAKSADICDSTFFKHFEYVMPHWVSDNNVLNASFFLPQTMGLHFTSAD